jgi:hypothetical protein
MGNQDTKPSRRGAAVDSDSGGLEPARRAAAKIERILSDPDIPASVKYELQKYNLGAFSFGFGPGPRPGR